MSGTGNIFQKMSSEIAKLKAELAELKVKKGFDQKAKIESQHEEIDSLTRTNMELIEEISNLRTKLSDLQDLNSELLNRLSQ